MNLKIKKSNVIIISLLLLTTLITCYGMPMDWSIKSPLDDSTYYLYFAQAMRQGLVMYRDIFDHKGPLLFVINLVGTLISRRFGVWLLCAFFIFMYHLFAYKTANLVTRKSIATLISIMTAPAIWGCLETGNYSDLYAMPFIMYSVYIYLKYLMDENSIKTYQIVLVGFCFACSFLLRGNLVAPWAVFSIAILFNLIYKKQFKNLGLFCLYFFGGVLIVFVPFIIYFISKGCLNEAIYVSLIFNFKYTGTSDTSFIPTLVWLYNFMEHYYFVALLLIYGAFVAYKRKNLLLHISNALFIILSIFLLCISRRTYLHYILVFIPCMIFPIAYIASFVNKEHNKFFVTAFTVILLIINVFNLKEFINTYRHFWNGYQNPYMGIVEHIKNNTTSQDTIYTHRLNGFIYVLSDRLSATKYFCLPAVNVDDYPEMQKEFLDELKSNKPKMIAIREHIIKSNYQTDIMLMDLIQRDYEYYTEEQNITLYIRK